MDAFPKEANKLRPGIVVETSGLFAPRFSNVLVVPCTTVLTHEVPSLCVMIEPDDTNGFDRPNWAIAYGVTSASKRRIVRKTANFVNPNQLAAIRAQLAEILNLA